MVWLIALILVRWILKTISTGTESTRTGTTAPMYRTRIRSIATETGPPTIATRTPTTIRLAILTSEAMPMTTLLPIDTPGSTIERAGGFEDAVTEAVPDGVQRRSSRRGHVARKRIGVDDRAAQFRQPGADRRLATADGAGEPDDQRPTALHRALEHRPRAGGGGPLAAPRTGNLSSAAGGIA